MPVVYIPSLLQTLTDGEEKMIATGDNVRQVIEALEIRFPGIKARLCDGDRLMPSILVVVDGEISHKGLQQRLTEASEVHFLPAISGG
jgi:sulfur-carrier protein